MSDDSFTEITNESWFGRIGGAVKGIVLKRQVEMYQWKENKKRKTRKKLGGGKKTITTYSYSKSWSTRLIDSSNFKKSGGHQNPDSMPYQSTDFIADDVRLGEFKLSRSLVTQINRSSVLPVSEMADIENIPNASYHGNNIYFGINPSSPQIGDVKTQQIKKNAGEMLRKGQNYFRTGQYDKAVMEFSRALKSGGDRKLALYNRGVALFKLNKKEAALKGFKYAAGMGHEKSKAILLKVRNSSV